MSFVVAWDTQRLDIKRLSVIFVVVFASLDAAIHTRKSGDPWQISTSHCNSDFVTCFGLLWRTFFVRFIYFFDPLRISFLPTTCSGISAINACTCVCTRPWLCTPGTATFNARLYCSQWTLQLSCVAGWTCLHQILWVVCHELKAQTV